jgi:hypothetical protein
MPHLIIASKKEGRLKTGGSKHNVHHGLDLGLLDHARACHLVPYVYFKASDIGKCRYGPSDRKGQCAYDCTPHALGYEKIPGLRYVVIMVINMNDIA